MRKNPYEENGKWWFYDETGDVHGPYRSEARANRNLTAYCCWLDKGPTRWQRIWWPAVYRTKSALRGFHRLVSRAPSPNRDDGAQL